MREPIDNGCPWCGTECPEQHPILRGTENNLFKCQKCGRWFNVEGTTKYRVHKKGGLGE